MDGKPFVPIRRSAQWNCGAYLVNGLGHCAECHSPRNFLGGIVSAQRFAGGPNPEGEGWVPNITQKGLGEWSAKDFAYFLETGQMPDSDFVGGSMARVIKNTSQLSPEDRAAMADYLKSLPPVEGPPRPKKAERAADGARCYQPMVAARLTRSRPIRVMPSWRRCCGYTAGSCLAERADLTRADLAWLAAAEFSRPALVCACAGRSHVGE